MSEYNIFDHYYFVVRDENTRDFLGYAYNQEQQSNLINTYKDSNRNLAFELVRKEDFDYEY